MTDLSQLSLFPPIRLLLPFHIWFFAWVSLFVFQPLFFTVNDSWLNLASFCTFHSCLTRRLLFLLPLTSHDPFLLFLSDPLSSHRSPSILLPCDQGVEPLGLSAIGKALWLTCSHKHTLYGRWLIATQAIQIHSTVKLVRECACLSACVCIHINLYMH